MASLFMRLGVSLLLSYAACSRDVARSSQPSATMPEAPPASQVDVASGAVEPEPQPPPDAKPDASGWGVAAGLRYLEIVRGDAEPEDKLPLLIVIHGLGDKPSRDWLSAIDLDPSLKARMILPQAPTPYSRGFAWFPYRFRDHVSLAEGISKAEAALVRAIEQLLHTRPTQGRVILCGFSQGGMLSFALALAQPELFQLALPISGMLPEELWPQTKPRGFIPRLVALHGKADPVVDFEADAKLVRQLRDLQYPVELAAYEGVGHHISPEMSARVRAELSAAVVEMTRKH